jgi:hypothetical protein
MPARTPRIVLIGARPGQTWEVPAWVVEELVAMRARRNAGGPPALRDHAPPARVVVDGQTPRYEGNLYDAIDYLAEIPFQEAEEIEPNRTPEPPADEEWPSEEEVDRLFGEAADGSEAGGRDRATLG